MELLLNPDQSDWNTYCQSYERNERSMLDFEGNMSKSSWRFKNQVVFEDEDNDMTALDSTMASVSASYQESNIDTNVSAELDVSPSVEQHSIPSSNVAFAMLWM